MHGVLRSALALSRGALLAWLAIAIDALRQFLGPSQADVSTPLLLAAIAATALMPALGLALASLLVGLLDRRTGGRPSPSSPSGGVTRALSLMVAAMVPLSLVLPLALRPLVPTHLAYPGTISHFVGTHLAVPCAAGIAWLLHHKGHAGPGAFPWWGAAVLHIAARGLTRDDLMLLAPHRLLQVDMLTTLFCLAVGWLPRPPGVRRHLAWLALAPLAASAGIVFAAALAPTWVGVLQRAAPAATVALTAARAQFDFDADGFPGTLGGFDCDDSEAAVHPMALEVVGDGVDNNCMGGDLAREAPRTPQRRLPEARSRNVVLIVIDTLRADILERDAPVVTPNLRALSKHSAVFTRAYAHAPYTSESLRSLMTGQLPMSMTVLGSWLGMEAPLQLVFHASGYQTSALTELILISPLTGLSGETTPVLSHFDRTHNRKNDNPHHTTTSRSTTDLALAEIQRLQADPRPFFFWLHYFDPHGEYLPRQDTPFEGDRPFDRYRQEVFATDRDLGRFLSHLERSGFFDDGYLAVTADHGELFGEHGRYQHAFTLDEEVLHVPLLIRGPDVPPGRYRSRVRHVDVFPTLLELAASAVVPSAGRNLEGIWSGREATDRDVVAHTSYGRKVLKRALMHGDHKLVVDVASSYRALFDLASPEPERNRSAERPELTRRLEHRLGEYWDRAINDRILARRRLHTARR